MDIYGHEMRLHEKENSIFSKFLSNTCPVGQIVAVAFTSVTLKNIQKNFDDYQTFYYLPKLMLF